MNQLVITKDNFDQYFFDIKNNKPKKDQIMVCYQAVAELVGNKDKKELVELLCRPDSAVAASQMMKNVFKATEEDSLKIPLQIIFDLQKGMSIDKVLKKPYKFKLEMFYYTWPECLPDDPHWKSISLINLEHYLKVQQDAENAEKEFG